MPVWKRIVALAAVAGLMLAAVHLISSRQPAATDEAPRAKAASPVVMAASRPAPASAAGHTRADSPLGEQRPARAAPTPFTAVFTMAPAQLLQVHQQGLRPEASDAEAYLALKVADLCIDAVTRSMPPEPAKASPLRLQRSAAARSLLDSRCQAFYRVPIRGLREAMDRLRTRLEVDSPEFGGDIGNIHREDRPDQAKAKAHQLIALYERHGTDALLWSSGALSSHLLARLKDAETDPQAFRRRERIILAATAIAHCQSGNACHAGSLQTVAACASALLCGDDLQDAVLAPFSPDDRAAALKLAQDIFGHIQRREYAQLGLNPS